MKTDLIEIFQTIRAAMQRYEALGFATRINSDEEYDLWSEKVRVVDGEEKLPVYFAGVKIRANDVVFMLGLGSKSFNAENEINDTLQNLFTDIAKFEVKVLDELLMEQISDALAKGLKIYKQQEWV